MNTNIDIVKALTDEQLELAYRIREKQYRIQDAKDHVEDFVGDDEGLSLKFNNPTKIIEWAKKLDDSDYEQMAETFLENYDCNITENMQWEAIVTSYFMDLFE